MPFKKNAGTVAFLTFFSSLLVSAAPLTETLVINTTGNPPLNTPDNQGFMDRVATEAFKRAGVKIKTIKLPAERGLKNVNAGIDDGEMSRIAGLEKVYPNMIMIPEKIMQWEFSGFANQKLQLDGKWENLAPYSVSFIIGWKILENSIPAGSENTQVQNQKQLFSLLHKKRTDVVIYERWGGLQFMKDHKISNATLLEPPFAVKDMYIYLNATHKHLVPKVSAALRTMKTDGSYQKIYDQVLTPLVKER